jgi:hypothetical protein
MIVAPSTRWLRTRLAAVFAAGPLSNALLLACSVPLLSDADAFGELSRHPTPVLAFAMVNGTMAVLNAVPAPSRAKTADAEAAPNTDGWNLLTVPFRDSRRLAQMVIAHTAWKASHLLSQGKTAEASVLVEGTLKQHPESPLARIAYSDLLVMTRRWPEAAQHLRLLLADAEVKQAFPAAIPLLANNLAWADFAQDDPALLDEADLRSQEAIAGAPDSPLTHGTRGAVLLARGLLEQAQEKLVFAFARNQPVAKALNACCLAMLHARKGDRAHAQEWLGKARQLDPKCYLIARAEAEMTPVAPGAPVTA